MTTNHHTPIANAATNAIATLNTPLGALDSAITDMRDGTLNLDSPDIDGGTVDGATIGGSSAGAATLSDFNVSGSTIAFPGAFYAYISGGAQVISASTTTVVALAGELYDEGGYFDTTAKTYTPTVAGYYFLHAQTSWTNGAVDKTFIVYITDAGSTSLPSVEGRYVPAVASMSFNVSVSTIRYLDGSTAVDVRVFQNDTSSHTLVANTYDTFFTGFRIG